MVTGFRTFQRLIPRCLALASLGGAGQLACGEGTNGPGDPPAGAAGLGASGAGGAGGAGSANLPAGASGRGAGGALGGGAGRATGGAGVNTAGTSGTAAGTAGSGGTGGTGGMTPDDGGQGGSADAGRSGGAGASSGAGNGGTSAGGSGGGSDREGWVLSWNDEFDGESGESPDPSKWTFDIGGNGWGNNELQYYTSRPENAALNGSGMLVITARAESYMDRDYTSARMLTKGIFEQTYGRFEARIKVPGGTIWPAFWMLGGDIDQNVWPNCGEIDIMEIVGKEPSTLHGSLHGPGYSGGNPLTETYALPNGIFADGFHVFAVEWEEEVVRWYVNDTLYSTKTTGDVPGTNPWVYDHPFFLLLNLAIGGPFPGPPGDTQFPQMLTVDYVRVYQRE